MAAGTRSSAPRAAGGDGTEETGSPAVPAGGHSRFGRAAVWTGITLGTAVAGLAISDGAAPQLGGMPRWAGTFLGLLLIWLIIVLAAVTLAELTRRHHTAARQYAFRQGKRGVLATGLAIGRAGKALWDYAAAWAEDRWQARQARRARRICAACGNPESGTFGPLALYKTGDGETQLIHQAHFEDPATGYHGLPYKPLEPLEPRSDPAADTPPAPADARPEGGAPATTTSPAGDSDDGGTTMPAPSTTGPGTSRARATLPSEWAGVATRAADFIPGDDAELLEWMGQEVTGISSWAEALIETYATLAEGIGVDPAALTLLHDVADAAAQCAETMGGAAKKFADHYERPREFAADGGKFPHYGPWITGEGEA
jgi:hypothetical protein